MVRGCLLPWALLLCCHTVLLGDSRLFVADEQYKVIWLVETDSGTVVRGTPIPELVAAGNSRVGRRGLESGLAFDGESLYYTNAGSRAIWVLDPATGETQRTFDKPEMNLSGLTIVGSVLAAVTAESGDGGTLLVGLDATSGEELSRSSIPGVRRALAYDPEGDVGFTSVGALEVRSFRPDTNESLLSFSPPAALVELAYSVSTKTLFGLGADGMLYSLNPEDGSVNAAVRVTLDDGGEPILGSGLAPADGFELPDESPGSSGGGKVPGAVLRAQETVIAGRDVQSVPVLLTNAQEIHGFSLALLHDPSVVQLDSIRMATSTFQVLPEFVGVEVLANGGTTSVVLDLPPVEAGRTLIPGENRVIAEYTYSRVRTDQEEDLETQLRFVDGVLGTPPKENLLLRGEGSVRPQVVVARITSAADAGPAPILRFLCGGPLDDDGLPGPLMAGPGESVELSLYYTFNDDMPRIQGVTMALAYDCALSCREDSFVVPGDSATSEVQAEFVDFSCENDPDDGDGCEMTLGILVDELPPFDGRLLPSTDVPLLLGAVTLEVDRSVPVGDCLEIRFRDGLNSRQVVPVNNLVSIENLSMTPELTACDVCVTPVETSLLCGADTLDERGIPELVAGERGEEVEVSFWYRSPRDDLHGLTQAIRYDCQLECLEDTFRLVDEVSASIPDALVLFHCDNDPEDGDGCEMVLEVAPLSGAESPVILPAVSETTRFASVSMRLAADTANGACLQLEHMDEINGDRETLSSNTAVFATGEVRPSTVDCQACTPPADQAFFCGGPVLDEDGFPVPIDNALRGEAAEVSLWYSSPVDPLSDSDEVQGMSMALAFDCRLTCVEDSLRFPLDAITAEIEPEFATFDCDNEPLDGDGCEMIFGLLVDSMPPFDAERLLPATDVPLKVAAIDLVVPSEASLGSCFSVEFRDGVNGSTLVPVKNLISADNQAISPQTFDCEICVEALGPKFVCGGPELGPDDLPVTPRGLPGETVDFCFWYCAPEDHLPGHDQLDHLQGFTMGLTFDCALTCVEDSFRIPEDSISAALGVDFVSFSCDNDPADGDGCEMVFGVLVDAAPPFDGQTFPPTEVPLKLACVDLLLPPEAPCNACFDVRFEDGVNGSAKIPVKNLISVANQAFAAGTTDCEVCVTDLPKFRRGDCNTDGEFNISDATTIVSFLFMEGTWKPELSCLDACDVNDDGRLDLSDVFTVLSYVFNLQELTIPAPGPFEFGPDPTHDKLRCEHLPCVDEV